MTALKDRISREVENRKMVWRAVMHLESRNRKVIDNQGGQLRAKARSRAGGMRPPHHIFDV